MVVCMKMVERVFFVNSGRVLNDKDMGGDLYVEWSNG